MAIDVCDELRRWAERWSSNPLSKGTNICVDWSLPVGRLTFDGVKEPDPSKEVLIAEARSMLAAKDLRISELEALIAATRRALAPMVLRRIAEMEADIAALRGSAVPKVATAKPLPIAALRGGDGVPR